MSPILAYPGRRLRNPYTTVYDCTRSINGTYPAVLCRVTWLSITIVFHRFVYEGIQSFTIANDLSSTSSRVVNDGCARNFRAVLNNDDDKQPFPSIRRWSSFTLSDTAKYDRNTKPCYTVQYDRIYGHDSRVWPLTIVGVWPGLPCCASSLYPCNKGFCWQNFQ